MLRQAMISVLGLLTCTLSQAFLLPNQAPVTASLQERRMYALGQEYMQHLSLQVPILHDPLVQTYLDTLGQALAKHSQTPQRRFHFFMIQANTLNAFTGPDAHIGVHSALVLQTDNEAELAGVLAHEIGHVTEKHIERMLAQETSLKASALAGMAAAIALSTVNANAGIGALMATQASLENHALKFSRRNEAAADRAALKTLQRSGINPKAMVQLLQKMARNQRYHPDRPPEYLLTHPHESTRIADILNRLPRSQQSYAEENPLYRFLRERVRVLTSQDLEGLLQDYKKRLRAHSKDNALHYGYALALLKGYRFSAANTELNALLQDDPENCLYGLALAHSEGLQQHEALQLTLLAHLHEKHPKHYAILLAYSVALLNNQQSNLAAHLLENYYWHHPKAEVDYSLLSRAQAHAGYLASAYQTRASAFLRYGDKAQALLQLKTAAQLLANDADQLAQIKAELAELE